MISFNVDLSWRNKLKLILEEKIVDSTQKHPDEPQLSLLCSCFRSALYSSEEVSHAEASEISAYIYIYHQYLA